MAKIGYVGLGVMGGGVARRLLEAGHEVTGHNRTRSKAEPLIAAGMRFADTPREVAEQSDVVFSMVTNTRALAAVTEGPDGILAGLGPGKVYVDMSTVSPAASRALAERVAERGAAHARRAGVGQRDHAGAGQALGHGRRRRGDVRAGPADPARHRAQRSRTSATTARRCSMKIAINLSLAVQMLAFSEGVLLAEKGGISREDARARC